MLRKWQQECSEKALKNYKSSQHHFFCQATPGAGKTVLAATIASRLLKDGMVDLILCFSPSLTVSDGIKRTFSEVLNRAFTGGLGSIGQSLTYQSIQFLSEEFWQTLRNYRVFVVFDEIHHCSGSEYEKANVWGQQILTKIQGLATYTLALSGTPWRSDASTIVMAQYSDPDGQILVDYQYTLQQAVADHVCRAPRIVLVDNEHLSITSDGKTESFSSILEMLKQNKAPYQSVIHNQEAMEHLLELGCRKLAEIRTQNQYAGGLVVASSVQHAEEIKKILLEKCQQTVSIVTYRHEEPLAEIERYRKDSTQWIVSVGMISEGTDIPRLQVCCHMSSVKTELYFRQVLGRVLRVNNDSNQQAWLFTFAEQSLIEFAERIEQDIPESCMFISGDTPETFVARELGRKEAAKGFNIDLVSRKVDLRWNGATDLGCMVDIVPSLSNEVQFGTFKQRIISAFQTV
ncbi:DEAD/DEAH box helicase family protein [Vibrio parahaemolyticus]|nr:DEAD/DEAH box helicase family protein [Vibrio parahaemolyticus]